MAHFKSGEAKEEVERGGREAKKKKKKKNWFEKGSSEMKEGNKR